MSDPPLGNLRFTDFCWWGVGALATRYMADFGAQVIKIEDRVRLDLTRTLPPFPDRVASMGDITFVPNPNRSGFFNNYNRNKLSITINMRLPQGRDLVRKLVNVSDVVSENFRPGVMERWGLDYEELSRLKDDIIFLRLSGLGHSGPEKEYGTAGPVVQALSGLSFMAGLPGREPSGYGYSYMDNTAAYYGVMACLLALYHRGQHGCGQEVNVCAVEAGVNLLGPDLLDYTVNGNGARASGLPRGNRLSGGRAAPHGVYPTIDEDRWLAVAVTDDEEWRALLSVAGQDCEIDDRWATLAGRVADQDALDEWLTSWTRTMDRYEAMNLLQRAGVPAGAVQTGEDRVTRDPVLGQAKFFRQVEHPEMGPSYVEGMPIRLSESPVREDWSAGPTLGQHTHYVLNEILGMGSREVEQLETDGAI